MKPISLDYFNTQSVFNVIKSNQTTLTNLLEKPMQTNLFISSYYHTEVTNYKDGQLFNAPSVAALIKPILVVVIAAVCSHYIGLILY